MAPASPVTLTFPKPGRAVTANDRLHWAAKRRQLAPWRAAVRYAWLQAGRPTPGPCTVQIAFPVPDKRRRDPSNLMPTQKAMLDELVKAGCWPDDTPEWVIEEMPTVYVGTDVVLTITPR